MTIFVTFWILNCNISDFVSKSLLEIKKIKLKLKLKLKHYNGVLLRAFYGTCNRVLKLRLSLFSQSSYEFSWVNTLLARKERTTALAEKEADVARPCHWESHRFSPLFSLFIFIAFWSDSHLTWLIQVDVLDYMMSRTVFDCACTVYVYFSSNEPWHPCHSSCVHNTLTPNDVGMSGMRGTSIQKQMRKTM